MKMINNLTKTNFKRISNLHPGGLKTPSTTDYTRSSFFSLVDVSGHLETSLKERVRLLLLRKGLSQNKLAEAIGINQGTMSKIVNGDWIPTSKIKISMARELDCDSLVLFGDSGYWKDYSKKIIYIPKKQTPMSKEAEMPLSTQSSVTGDLKLNGENENEK